MQTLTSLDAVNRKLDECAETIRVAGSAKALFQSFEMAFATDGPEDPFSPEYRAFQMRVYERVAGKPYALANEATPMDVADAIRRPFPYMTGDPATAGEHLGAVSALLRSLRLRPGARILEFGPGWGNTTLELASLGFDVTAVDVEPKFCDVIRGRAARLELPVRVVNANFFWAEEVAEPFDAAVFFECFHHCDDHMRLLRALRRAVKPSGLVYFGAEPILAEYPVPWGVRMDGEALWAMREHGWLELGFRESYFREALLRTGWIARKQVSADLPWVSVWEASASADGPTAFSASDERLGTMTGIKTDGVIRIVGSAKGYGVYGPHVPLGPGRYRGTLRFAPGGRLSGHAVIDVCADRGRTPLGSAAIDLTTAGSGGEATLDFDVAAFVDEVEVRLFCLEGASAEVSGLEIVQLQEPIEQKAGER